MFEANLARPDVIPGPSIVQARWPAKLGGLKPRKMEKWYQQVDFFNWKAWIVEVMVVI